MIDLAPGVPGVAALVKAAGYQPPSEGTNDPLTGDAAEYVQQGNPSAAAYRNNTYQRNPLQPNPVTNQLDRLSAYAPGPPTAPDPRDPRYRPVAPPDYLQPQAAQVYDTAVIAHAVLSDGKGEMTAVAVAHPAEDMHAVKKQLAERIANAVLRYGRRRNAASSREPLYKRGCHPEPVSNASRVEGSTRSDFLALGGANRFA